MSIILNGTNPLQGLAAATGNLTFSAANPGGEPLQNPFDDSLIYDPTAGPAVSPAISFNNRYDFSNAWLKLKQFKVQVSQTATYEHYAFYPDPNSPPPPEPPNPPIRYLRIEQEYNLNHTFYWSFVGNSASPWYGLSSSTVDPAPLRLKTINRSNRAYYENSLSDSPDPNVGTISVKIYDTSGGSQTYNGNLKASISGDPQIVAPSYSNDKWFMHLTNAITSFALGFRYEGDTVPSLGGVPRLLPENYFVSTQSSQHNDSVPGPFGGSSENFFYGTGSPPTGDADNIYTFNSSQSASFRLW